ncbi:MAG: ferritin-like domain-containing protein [Sulfurospirillum sp.]|nr:ferritin-like domain-containing protein [Sulfurospirillum sp. 'SP']WNY98663.1 ferritin-like domain-containing protein [Sulfurospirillum sp. 'SP']
MKRDKSIELLNRAIADELSAVHQYMFLHFHCDDQGYDLLSTLFKRTAIAEMLHIERLADRVLFLKGTIEMKASEEVKQITDVKAMLEFARQSEEDAIVMYNNFAIECGNHADSVSKKLFEELVLEEEGHFAEFDDEMENMLKFGEQYLVLQSMERSKKKATMAAAAAPTGEMA